MSAVKAPIATDCRLVVRRCPEGHVHLAIVSPEVTLDLPMSADQAHDLSLALASEALDAVYEPTEVGSCH